MNLTSKIFTCIILSFVLAACSTGGNDDESKNYAKSLANIEEVANNFNRIERAASGYSRNGSEISSTIVKPSSVADESAHEKTRRMEQAMQNCTVTSLESMPDPSQTESFQMKIGFEVSGECPIYSKMLFSLEMAPQDGQGRGSYEVNLDINDVALADMNDVSAAHIEGSFSASSTTLTGTTTGKIISKKFGNVLVSGSISGVGDENKARKEERLGFTIKDELFEFLQIVNYVRDQEPIFEYQINGQKVSEAEYQAAMAKLGFLGLGASSNGNNSPLPEEDEITDPGPNPDPGNDNTPGKDKTEIQCRLDVIKQRLSWSVQDAAETCANADYDCVMYALSEHPSYGPDIINALCSK